MHISEVMTRTVDVTDPGANLRDVANMMRDLDVGMIPVCDGERLVGTVTDRDIVIRAVAGERDVAKTTVAEVMTPEVVYCFEDQDTEDAARLMSVQQIRRLPILDRNKRLTGILSLGDLAVRGEQELAGDTLESVSEEDD